MVVKSQRGMRYPMHVQTWFYAENTPQISIEKQCCMNFIEIYLASGLKHELCDHLETVITDHCFRSHFC